MRREKLTKGKIRAKVALWSIVVAMAAAVFVTPFAAGAQTIEDLTQELENVNSKKDQAKQELEQEKRNLQEIQDEVNALDRRITSATAELNNLLEQENETKAAIEAALAELEQLQKDIEKQNDDLNARLRSMYKNGDVGMLSVLFGSSSMSDFMTNMDMVERIYNADA